MIVFLLAKVKHYIFRRKIFVNRLIDSYQWYLRDRTLDPPQELMESLKNLNANSISHSSTTLLRHLVRTYQLLKKWKVPEYVCVSGLYHSIYGTQTFQKFLIDPQQREPLLELVSYRSEKLVYYFYIHDKKDFLKNLTKTKSLALKNRFDNSIIYISADEFLDLLRIRLADYIEQMERTKSSANFLKGRLDESKSFIDGKEYSAILNNLPVSYLKKT